MFSLVFLLKRFLSLARLTPRRSCAGLRLSMNFHAPGVPSLRPLFRSESGCKSTAFFITRNTFFQYFETFLYYIDYQIIKTTYFFQKSMALRTQKPIFRSKKAHFGQSFPQTFMFLKKKGDFLFYLPDLLWGNTLLI